MLGESPSFQGVLADTYDTAIEVPKTNAQGSTKLTNYEAKRCKTTLIDRIPDMTKVINSGEEKEN